MAPGQARAAEPSPAARAWSLHFQGKTLQARRGLEAYLETPEGREPGERLIALEQLLDICIRSLADACLQKHAPAYAQLAGSRPFANEIQKVEAARRAGYYLFGAQAAAVPDAQVPAILANDNWKLEHAYDVELYLRRQVLASRLHLRAGRRADANRAVDKILSLIASLDEPAGARSTVMWALSDSMETLLALGDVDRAYGILRSTGRGVGAVLPPQSFEAALFELRAGVVLNAAGRPEEAGRFLDLAVATLDGAELEAGVQRHLLALALTAKAQACLATTSPCAPEALGRHPFKDLYATPGRAPQNWAEVEYLSARALASASAETADPIVADALQRPPAFKPEPSAMGALKIHQALGRALASPPGEGRGAALREAGRRIRAALVREDAGAPFGAWYRAGAFDQSVLRLALAQAEAYRGEDGADIVFTLLQLADRRGQTFDADALSLLGRARDPLERRAVHQALRLRVRRDALERDKLQAVAGRLTAAPASPAKPDFAVRRQFADYAARIDSAAAGLGEAGLPVSGVDLVSLKALQSALAPDEAALLIAPSIGDALVYMCVRRDTTTRRVIRTDLKPLRVDMRLIQAALTAGHPPSDALDGQFPAASSTRLYDVFIRPFEPCLKAGDHIVWLPGLSLSGFPLAALLDAPPPKLERGYDLAEAGWLVRRHAVTYAGSAAAVVAARSGPRRPPAQFDFLGVGDPEFSGATPTGEDRAKLVTRGVRAASGLSTLPPLPETEDELRRSAAGFRNARLLLEDAASEGGFRKELAGAYRYLSFATHGLIRDDLQGLAEPALALTPVSGATAFDDGLLTAPEIADLNLSARFVALSACNTANFDLARMAQDLPSLASAFAVAGVPATLGTLWPVDSTTGEQVVAGTFERLRAGRPAAYALAEAQRAFLDKPPSRAHLHPRFWSPFVVMGDGGTPSVAEPAEGALSVQALEAATPPPGLFRARLGAHEVIGETVREGDLLVPSLRLVDAATGSAGARWRDASWSAPGAAVAAGAALADGRAAFAVASLVGPGEVGKVRPKLAVFVTDAALQPRRLFEVETPGDLPVQAVTLTPVAGGLLATYSASLGAERTAGLYKDDFDQPVCPDRVVTHVELRDLSTGALKSEVRFEGRLVSAAAVRADGGVLLGGTDRAACAQTGGAVLVSLDADLKATMLYRDTSLGASDVRALAPLADGRVFVAASKDNTVEFRPPSTTPALPTDGDVARALHGGLLLVVGPDGRASEPLLLDSGTTLFLGAAEAAGADGVALSATIGDRPVRLRLAAGPRR